MRINLGPLVSCIHTKSEVATTTSRNLRGILRTCVTGGRRFRQAIPPNPSVAHAHANPARASHAPLGSGSLQPIPGARALTA
jgi:hypothetical protein